MSLYVEEFEIGKTVLTAGRTIGECDINIFAGLVSDFTPIHTNADYASKTQFGGRIAHGLYTASLISAILGMYLPGPGAIFLSQPTSFKAPVRIGETVTAICTVREVFPARRRVIFDCLCKVKDTVVVEGEATVMMPSRPAA